MNCDRVFDVLTRGPFPAGEPDDAMVERHLAECHGCRELAAALRPAIELIEETLRAEEKGTLPSYRGPWLTDWDEAAERGQEAVATLESRGLALRSQRAAVRFPALAQLAALAAGLLIGLFAYGAVKQREGGAALATRSVARADALRHGVTLACFAPPGESRVVNDLPDAKQIALACCTNCHAADGMAAMAKHATLRVAASCQLCHAQ